MCRIDSSKIYFHAFFARFRFPVTVATFCQSLSAIVIGGYWIVNILPWILSMARALLNIVLIAANWDIVSLWIDHSLSFPFSSFSVLFFYEIVSIPVFFLPCILCLSFLMSLFSYLPQNSSFADCEQFSLFLSQFPASRISNTPKEFIVAERKEKKTFQRAKQWQIPIDQKWCKKKKCRCIVPSIQSVKFIKKEIHFRATDFFRLSGHTCSQSLLLGIFHDDSFDFVLSSEFHIWVSCIFFCSRPKCSFRLVDFSSVCIQSENLTEILPGLSRIAHENVKYKFI